MQKARSAICVKAKNNNGAGLTGVGLSFARTNERSEIIPSGCQATTERSEGGQPPLLLFLPTSIRYSREKSEILGNFQLYANLLLVIKYPNSSINKA